MAKQEKWHIDPRGNAAICKAFFKCPFGGPEVHFSSSEAARRAFETQNVFNAFKTLDPESAKNILVASIIKFRQDWDRERQVGVHRGPAFFALEGFLLDNSVQINFVLDNYDRSVKRLEDEGARLRHKMNQERSGIENIEDSRQLVFLENEKNRIFIEKENFQKIMKTS